MRASAMLAGVAAALCAALIASAKHSHAKPLSLPVKAITSDDALEAEWMKENDECQGGIDPKAIARACPIRDQTEIRLQQRGVCWAYSDWRVFPADYTWHPCSQKRPVDFRPGGDRDADAPAVVAANHNDAWYQEKYRPKSAALAAYESAAEQIDARIALANAALICGLHSGDDYQDAVRGLEEYRNGPIIMRLRMRLTREETAQAGRYDRIVVDGVTQMNIGNARVPADEGCQGLTDRATQSPALLP